jgi:AcrR family transcriptional regulator
LLAPGNEVIIYTTYNLYDVEAIVQMPRTADPELPHNILKAADALWQSGGEEAVTIRAVAAEAGTTTPTVYSYYADREALLRALRALAFQRFSAHLAKSRDLKDTCVRHLEFGTNHPRDYELLYGRGWMERVTSDAQGSEIERYTAHIVRAGVDKSRAAQIAYPVMMMLHGVVMHRLLNKKPSSLGRAIGAACLNACMTLLESAKQEKT